MTDFNFEEAATKILSDPIATSLLLQLHHEAPREFDVLRGKRAKEFANHTAISVLENARVVTVMEGAISQVGLTHQGRKVIEIVEAKLLPSVPTSEYDFYALDLMFGFERIGLDKNATNLELVANTLEGACINKVERFKSLNLIEELNPGSFDSSYRVTPYGVRTLREMREFIAVLLDEAPELEPDFEDADAVVDSLAEIFEAVEQITNGPKSLAPIQLD